MEKRQPSFRRVENLNLAFTHIRLLISQKVSLLLHGRNRRSSGLQERDEPGQVH